MGKRAISVAIALAVAALAPPALASANPQLTSVVTGKDVPVGTLFKGVSTNLLLITASATWNAGKSPSKVRSPEVNLKRSKVWASANATFKPRNVPFTSVSGATPAVISFVQALISGTPSICATAQLDAEFTLAEASGGALRID